MGIHLVTLVRPVVPHYAGPTRRTPTSIRLACFTTTSISGRYRCPARCCCCYPVSADCSACAVPASRDANPDRRRATDGAPAEHKNGRNKGRVGVSRLATQRMVATGPSFAAPKEIGACIPGVTELRTRPSRETFSGWWTTSSMATMRRLSHAPPASLLANATAM